MKANYNRKVLKFTGLVGATGASFLMSLSAGANEVLNLNPSIFAETPYNRGQRVLNADNTPESPELTKIDKKTTPAKNTIAQSNQRGGLNPNPGIFNSPPYNRSRRTEPGQTKPTQVPTNNQTTPSTSPEPTQVPTTDTPTPPVTPDRPVPPVTPGNTPGTPRNIPGTPRNTPGTPGNIPTPPGGSSSTSTKNLVALAESDGSFTTLTKALKAAGLLEILQGKDNYTIFAPTDAAFAKLPQDAVRDLLKPENKEVLVKVLTYHVVKGQFLSTDLKSGEVKSVEGGAINVKVDPTTGVTVNEAKVTKADIRGSNGVIHAIDQVILPPDL